MKNAGTSVPKRIASLLLLTVLSMAGFAQGVLTKRPNVPINANCNGYLEYLPIGYESGSAKYPLIVYLSGIGSTGDGSDAQLENLFSGGGYPHEQQRNGMWQDAYTVNGQTHRFVIITPQFIAPMWNRFPLPHEVNDVINHAIANYRIDTSRIYLVGQSQGGNPVWEYPAVSAAYANRIAAIVPFAAVVFPFPEKANIIKQNKVAVWGFHSKYDVQVPSIFTEALVDYMNEGTPPFVEARKTMFNSNAHLCWFDPLTRVYTENGKNIYEWMLQFKRTPTKAYAGNDKEIASPASTAQLQAGGTGPNGTTAGYFWEKVSGPSGGSISNPTSATPTVSDLAIGTYYFRVTVSDNNGGSNSDEVSVLVHPRRQRIEAENYIAMNGVQTEGNSDEGVAGINVGYIDQGDWMDYSVNVPLTGNYKVRIRLSTFFTGARFVIRNSGGTALDTVDVFDSGGWGNYLTMNTTIPLQAGTQTIRFESITNLGWNLNWFEVQDLAPVTAPLPVNFSLVNAQCVNGSVNISWKTSGETNSNNFSIERSANGRDWTSIATLPSAGQSGTEQSYSYRDNAAAAGSLYRIVQQDFDGRKTTSSILRSNCGKELSLSVYPNPVNDVAVLSISLAKKSRLSVSVIDGKGSVVRQQESLLPEGASQMSINMQGLSTGTYTLRAQWDGEVRTLKVVKR